MEQAIFYASSWYYKIEARTSGYGFFFVEDIVLVVHIAANKVEITLLEGLLDLNVPIKGLSQKEIWKEVKWFCFLFCIVRSSKDLSSTILRMPS